MNRYFHQDFVERPDGTRIYYQVYGEGPLGIVLNDGIGCDGFAWKYLLPQLAETHRVVRWHYRGHGQSGIPEDRSHLGMSYNCDDLAAVLDAAGLPRAVVAGHSMGVQVALEFDRCYPKRVLGLMLLCGSYGVPLDTFHDTTALKTAFPYLKAAVERFPLLARRINGLVMGTELVVDFAMAVELNRELMKRGDMIPYFNHLARMDPVVFMRTLESLASHTTADHLADVRAPTLVIGGEKDKFTPAWLSREMATRIPAASLVMIEGGTHTAPLEAPGIVREQVFRFLERLQKPPRARKSSKGAPRRRSARPSA